MKRYVFITLKVLLISILAFSVFRLASLGAGLVRDRENIEKLKTEMIQEVETVSSDAPEYVSIDDDKEMEDGIQPDTGDDSSDYTGEKNTYTSEKDYKVINRNQERFASFSERNHDFAGWLNIPGTSIDYPVMYSPKDADFYLHHDFDGNESKSGVPYIGKDCNLHCDNTIIYAHNMKNGTMFAGLLKYADVNFFRNYSEISFDTLQDDGIYDIIAVFREKVHYKDETDVFRYYNYSGELTETQFNDYISNIKNISLYDTGKTAVYGQKLITLSTCSYHTENGRFVVVAVKR